MNIHQEIATRMIDQVEGDLTRYVDGIDMENLFQAKLDTLVDEDTDEDAYINAYNDAWESDDVKLAIGYLYDRLFEYNTRYVRGCRTGACDL